MGNFVNRMLYSILLASSVAAASAGEIDAAAMNKSTVASYKVKEKETLSSIAEKLGLSSYHQIEDVNKGLNPNRLQIGQEINIPVFEHHLNGVKIDLAKVRSAVRSAVPIFSYYEVEKGDSLSAIAKRFGITLKDIYSSNPALKSHPDRLSIGDGIFIKKNPAALTASSGIEKKLASTPPAAARSTDVSQSTVKSYKTEAVAKINYSSGSASSPAQSKALSPSPQVQSPPVPSLPVQSADAPLISQQRRPKVQDDKADWYVRFNGPQIRYEVPARHIGGSNPSIDKILFHITDAATASSTVNWFMHPDPPKGKAVSAHYLIDLDGKIIQFVPEDRIAYHCYGSNKGSIGIEFVGRLKDGGKVQTYTDKQLAAGVGLVLDLASRHNLGLDDIYGHFQFDGVKPCPGAANYNVFMNMVNAAFNKNRAAYSSSSSSSTSRQLAKK